MTVPDLIQQTQPGLERPQEPLGPRLLKWGITLAIIIPVIWAAIGLEITPARIARAPGDLLRLANGMWPPDFSDPGRIFEKIMESLYVAWVATIIGATLSFPLAFLAATNISPRWINLPVRGFLSAVRAFPELVLAIMFIPAFGLGPLAGTLAIGLHSIGTLGKLSSEVIEGVSEGPIEAIRASGGTRAAQMRFGIIPQAMPTIVAYWLFRFEINIRASAVLGVIGAGGIGTEIVSRMQFRADWGKALASLLILIAVVLVIDSASAAVRRRIITGQPSTGPLSKWTVAITGVPRTPDTEIP